MTVTESLVDAKDEARQAEVRTDIAKAVLTVIVWTIGINLIVAGLIIAALR